MKLKGEREKFLLGNQAALSNHKISSKIKTIETPSITVRKLRALYRL